ncbi:hypothetical protein [Sphingomonas trueperi]|uniref:Uncharacterized protein n=1 Tax=Sphingomonas trueperi TaxID=53317 RepID=A0A7X6BEQ0_9SPHN|nr:hypothetical protein [Sphingomonas trueperi]NJB99903.1 hypothetical protein [Sphingomonas trueperi]
MRRRVDHPELRFLVKRALQTLPKSLLLNLNRGGDMRLRALDQATDIIMERLDHLDYTAPPPLENHGS